jgi:outer membrane immunogenic protein
MYKNLFLAVSMSAGAVATVFGGGTAQAASYGNTSPIYAGAGAGRSSYDVGCLANAACGVRSKASGKVYAGFNFAPMSAWPGSELTGSVELSTYLGGNAELLSQHGTQPYRAIYTYRGAGLGYRLMWRETESLSLSARLGVSYLNGKIKVAGGEAGNADKTALSGGLGASYTLDKHWSLNADYDLLQAKFDQDKARTIHLFTLGAGYKF